MILSRSKQFAFIHIPKTAGTSINRALNEYDDRPLLLKFLNNKVVNMIPSLRNMNPLRYHTTAADLESIIGTDLFNSLFSFAFVRNPWDWNVSRYHYISQSFHHPKCKIVRKMTFEQFLRWIVNNSHATQKSFITDMEGNIIIDFVGKFENIKEDFAYICERLGIDEELPHRNPSDHQHYRQYYNERTASFVEYHFKEDIRLFDYEF